MEREFGASICNIVLPPIRDRYRRVSHQSVCRVVRDASDESLAEHFEQIAAEWPQVVPLESKLECARQYLQGTKWPKVFTCSVCARELNHGDVLPVNHYSEGDFPLMILNLHFNLLVASDSERPDVVDIINHPLLSRYMLEPKGYVDGVLHMCTECESELIKGRLPMFALRNGLYCGHLPERFRDLTWVEEMACAIYRCTCHVTHLYNTPDDDQPRVFKGNTCTHDLNYVSTASELPRSPADFKGMLSIVFVSPKQSVRSCLRKFNYVWKVKVWDFLCWLAENNPMYSKIHLSKEHLALYENDEIPGLEARVMDFEVTDPEEMFQEETAGFAPHFASDNELKNIDSNILDEPLLERMGVSDIESVNIQGRTFQSSALKNLIRPPGKRPDLLTFCGEDAIGEYSNPRLMMGMFPTLYPYGKGSFEDSVQQVTIGFRNQANLYLDLSDRVFRRHNSFIFMAMNMIQHRDAHLHTHLAVKSSNFAATAANIEGVMPETLRSVSRHLEEQEHVSDLSADEQKVFTLLSKVRTISSKITGSEASKITYRNEIKAYCAHFSIPHIYFMANPDPVNSLIFQVIAGDTMVDLDEHFPHMVDYICRCLRLAADPVAALDFFNFLCKAMMRYLFG